ncbi:MAG: O-antigen ligase [Flavobacteriales bacterium]
MINLNLKDTLKYKINQASLLLLAFILPLHKALIVPLIFILFLTSLFNIKNKSTFQNSSFIHHFSIASLFILMILGLLWTRNMDWAFKNLEIKFSIIAFPIIMYLSNLKWSEVTPKVLMAFIEGCILSCFLLLLMALYYYLGTGDSNQFFYTQLSIMHHPSYMAMYTCFSICLVYLFSFSPKVSTHIKPIWALLILIFLSIFTLLLASKTGLISILIIHFSALSYWIIKHNKFKAGIISIAVIISIGMGGYFSSTFIQTRINELFITDDDLPANSSTSIRLVAWNSSMDLISKAPILGVGTGDAKDALSKEFLESGQFKLVEKSLNAHNQFLQMGIQLGIIGLLIFIFTLILPAILLWKQNFAPALFLALILIINGMTEAWLETQSGVIFFAFFTTLFWCYYQEIRDQQLISIE